MATATHSLNDASRMMEAIASEVGPYSVRGRIEVAGQLIGLSPTQARRLYYREWKTIPSHIMDRIRALYTETCESLEERARQQIEANDAASEKRCQQHACVDGEGYGPVFRLVERTGEGDRAEPEATA